MKTFIQFIHEGYNFLPAGKADVNASPFKKKPNLIKLLDKLIKVSGHANPLAIDLNKQGALKVHRDLDGLVDLPALKQEFGFALTFGNGTRGNAGSNNRGNLFEKYLTVDLEHYVTTRNLKADYKYPGFINDFCGKFISKAKEINILNVGGLNQKRPLNFKGKQPLIGNLEDIGHTVTDVTVVADRKDYYLSLKLGGTVTFFNAGVRKVFTAADFKAGTVKTKTGLSVLKMLGIDPTEFVSVFNDYDKTKSKKGQKKIVNVTSKIDKNMLHTFLKSGVGYGFFLVHAKNASSNKVDTFFVDKAFRDKSTRPTSVIVHYPTGGSAKRVDVIVETPVFSFKINIRNKQGGKEPSHIMCDYKIKH